MWFMYMYVINSIEIECSMLLVCLYVILFFSSNKLSSNKLVVFICAPDRRLTKQFSQFMRSPVIRSHALQSNCANTFGPNCPFFPSIFDPKVSLYLLFVPIIWVFFSTVSHPSLPVASYRTYKEHKGNWSSIGPETKKCSSWKLLKSDMWIYAFDMWICFRYGVGSSHATYIPVEEFQHF